MLYHDSFSLRLPIKCIDLDNTNGQLKLEGWLHDVLIFMTLYREALFYWLFQGGGTILLGTFSRRLVEFIYLCPRPRLCWRLAGICFYGQCFTWRAGHPDQVILLVWPKFKRDKIKHTIFPNPL